MTGDDQIESLRGGEYAACDRFVREHYLGLYRWLCRLTGRRDDAENLTQESFAAFWQSLKRKTPPIEARTWLYAIARNQWRKHCRRRGTSREEAAAHLEYVADSNLAPPEAFQQREFAAAVDAALAHLPADLREVFALRVWHQLSYPEIAAVQGIRADLVRWRFFRARQEIRARLRPWHEVEENRRGKR